MRQILDYADILTEAPCYLIYVWAADKFCKKYLGTSKKKELMFILFSFCGWMLLNIANRRYPVPYIFSVWINHILFMGLVLLLFGNSREKKILAASMLMTVVTLAGNFTGSFLSCLVLFFERAVKGIPQPLLGGQEAIRITCVSYVMVLFAIYWMSRHLISVFDCKPGKWYIALTVPLLVLIAVMDVAGWGASNGIMVRSGGNMGLYYDQIFSHIEICILTVLSMFAAGGYVFGMERIYLEQKKSSQYHLQIAVYKMLEEQHSRSERLRHDMKNHIIALSGMFRSKEWEKMGAYLKNMEDRAAEPDGDVTGNRAVDAILYRKREQAEKENVKWECDVRIPKACPMDEFDLCVLFGNLLDNALEACERMGDSKLHGGRCCFVNIQAKTVKSYFLLEVKNSMDTREKCAKGFTVKKNPQGHGIGLLNVCDVVDRYNGAINIEAENGIFVVSILIRQAACRA